MKKTDAPLPDQASSWPLFLTAHSVLTGQIEQRLAAAQLPPLAWYDVLWALERSPGQRRRMHELADAVVLSRSNLTRLVDRLAAAGLLEREADPDDRRGAYAVLSAQGAALRKAMWPHYGQAIGELYDAHLSDSEQAVLARAMGKLLAAARATRAG